MAIPKVDWQYWSQPSIQPRMRATVHFPSGNQVYTDDDISSVDLSLYAFDSTCSLFGKPLPSTGSLAILDYDQTLNPTNNAQLVAGIQIDLELGLIGYYGAEQLGPNRVAVVKNHEQVLYHGDTVWAFPFDTDTPLEEDVQFRLSFNYVMPDGSEGFVDQIGTVSELFYRPSFWVDSTHYAVVYSTDMEITNLAVQTVADLWYTFGTFYSQEWSYDSSGFTATVDIVDGTNDILQLDNRASGVSPFANANLLNTTVDYLELSTAEVNTSIVNSTVIPYFFYENSQAATVNALVEALGGMLFPMPDGTYMLCDYTGAYDTGITLTDNDVESYSMEETSTVTMDSAVVVAALPNNIESSEIANFSNLDIAAGDYIPLNTGRVMSVDYVSYQTDSTLNFKYDWDVVYLQYLGPSIDTLEKLTIYGHMVEPSSINVANVQGTLPYTIKDNNYIQTLDQAATLVTALDNFIDLKYRILTVTLRGCPGLWLGGVVTVDSDMYNIQADYVIIGIDFTYNGAVSTTLIMQRKVES